MNTNEIMIPSVTVTKGNIMFPSYASLKDQAEQIAAYVESVEVTGDNVKESKKMLATVNKAVKRLEDERIRVKKEMLEPYNVFESQVKEIVGIVKTADDVVRQQVKSLEEQEREAKEEQVRELFEMRFEQYHLPFLSFEDFIQPQHLNKSVTMKKVEEELVAWLERHFENTCTIKSMDNSDEIMKEYMESLDLRLAIEAVRERQHREQMLAQMKQTPDDDEPTAPTKRIAFIIAAEQQRLVELLLDREGIAYELTEI